MKPSGKHQQKCKLAEYFKQKYVKYENKAFYCIDKNIANKHRRTLMNVCTLPIFVVYRQHKYYIMMVLCDKIV